MSYLRRSILVFAAASFLIFSCSDDGGTNSESTIPENAMEFQSSQEVASYAQSIFYGVSSFMYTGTSYLDISDEASSIEKPSDAQFGDTTYYDPEKGLWISEGQVGLENDGNAFDSGFYYEIQFLSGDEPQQYPVNIDAMHIIMDIVGDYDYSYETNNYVFDLKYFMDLMYTGLQSTAVTVNGEGLYDYEFNITGQNNVNGRVYFKYTVTDLIIPEDGYPAGKISLETKRWAVDIVLDGTNTGIMTLKDGGTIVGTQNLMVYDDF